MRLYTTQHPCSCGIDRHARTMYVCILSQSGALLVPRNMKTAPETCLHVVAPYRQGLVGAVACLCTWYGLADRCADDGLPCVLGHALSLQALHGGKANKDTIDSHKMAAVLRGGMLPQAYVSPAQMRAPRAVLRRRMPLAHQRAALLAPVQHTHSQYHRPAMGTKIASNANRAGVAERCAAAAGPTRIAVALARITSYEARLRDVERPSVNTAKHPDAPPLSRLPTVPGLGTMRRLGLLDAIHALGRCPRVPAGVSSCRLGTGARQAAGQR